LLEVTALAAARGDRVLFADLGFSVAPGELLQVTGRNGTGKTTLLRVLARLARPEAGEVRWKGTPTAKLGDEFFADVCYLGHAPAIKDDLTAAENLRVSAGIAGVSTGPDEIRTALAEVGLAGREQLPGRVLSQGQRRRVALAQLYLGQRPLWLLDEPLAALDSEAADAFVTRLAAHLHGGGVAVVATHQALAPDAAAADGRGTAARVISLVLGNRTGAPR
jgi:heme exporter protein A